MGRSIGRSVGWSKGHRMNRRTLSKSALTGLFFIHKYRFLTIAQFARIATFSQYHAAEILRDLERWGIVGYFGYTGIPGHGKTPKVYYLKRRGWELLCAERVSLSEFSEVHKETTWTPYMYHRLRIIDAMVSLEIALRNRPHLSLIQIFLEYRMIKKGSSIARETTDFVSDEEVSDNKFVPDAVFILENVETKKRGLYFLEMDLGTEQIASPVRQQSRITIRHKFMQYDKYLTTGRFARTYSLYGEFRYFTLLFVTTGDTRIDNIRHALADLPKELHDYYRFTTFEAAMGDFFGSIWQSRLFSDTMRYSLVR
jgi:hypothetical protein